jgi:uncharacterized protein YbcI
VSEEERLDGQGSLHLQVAKAVARGHRSVVGRGPAVARAFSHHNVLVVVLENGLTEGERRLVAAGLEEGVWRTREQFHELLRAPLVDAVEELTGCHVEAFMSARNLAPDVTAELFVLDRPLPAVPP